MSYTVNYVQTTSTNEAIPLYWNDTTINYTVAPAHQVWGEDGYTTVPAVVLPVTHYGLVNKFSTIEEFYKVQPYAKVIDNVVHKPEGSYITSTVLITSTGGTRVLTTKEVEGFSITLSVPGLYRIDRSSGYKTTEVSLSIFYRQYNPADPNAKWIVLRTNYVIPGKQRAEILRTIKHSVNDVKLPMAKYEILVVRNTKDHTGNMDYADDVYIKEITEIVYSEIAYNHTALLGVKIRATDQLSGQLPTVTAVVKGVKVSVPSNLVKAYKQRYNEIVNGTLSNTSLPEGTYDPNGAIAAAYVSGWIDGQLGTEKVWTDNPVWCLYDLLTNKRYGLADYYKIDPRKKGLMLANFYLMAKYCDEAIEYEDDSGDTSITKKRPRFALNMVLDQSKPASEWVGQIAAIMRALVYYSEGIFWIDIDKPKPISQLFNMSNIKDYTQSCTSYRGIPNSYEVQWVNPLTNYEIDSFKLESKELQTNAAIEERKKALQLIGVTNFDQAKSVAKYALLAGQHRTKFVTFKTGTNGLRCTIADVIGVQHDVRKWGFGGKVESYDEDTRTLTVNPAVEFENAAEYKIKVAHTLDNIQEYTVVNNGAGSYTEIQIVETPTESFIGNEEFILGVASNTIAKFKVASIKRDADELVEITAVQYEESMFDAIDDTSDLGEFKNPNYSLLPNPMRASVQGVYASNKFYQTATGVWVNGVEVFYEAPKISFWKAAQLHYSLAGTGTYTTVPEINTSGYFLLPDLPAGDYQIVITSIYTNGKQTISDALSDGNARPWAFVTVDSFTPNELFLEGVSGLAIENRANDGTFIGKDCIIVWKKPLIAGEMSYAGTETSGAATTNTDSWFAHYIVEITGRSGDKRRTTNVYDEKFVYTFEMNYQDALAVDGDADRQFAVSVTAVDKIGRKSKTKSIECYNPAPAKIV
jgi:predicted phage tail protein